MTLRAQGFAVYKLSNKFSDLVSWAKEVLADDQREHLISIVVLDEHGRQFITLAELERVNGVPDFVFLRQKEIIERFETP